MWKPMHDAPRADGNGKPVQIRLYLPGANSEVGERGFPKKVVHGECVGHWDAKHSRWVDQATGAAVYPSQWKPLSE